MILVTGTGRCGTYSIIRQLEDAGLQAAHEPSPPLVRMVAAYWPAGGMSDSAAVGVLQRVRWAQDANAHWLFTTMLPALDHVFPDARWLWLIRNAPDTVASMLAHNWFDPSRDDDLPVVFMWPYGDDVQARTTITPTGPSLGAMSLDMWRRLPQVGRCAWWWGWVYQQMRDRDGTRYQIETERPGWLLDALNIDHRPQGTFWANRSDRAPQLPPGADLWIDLFCKEGMAELYGRDWKRT